MTMQHGMQEQYKNILLPGAERSCILLLHSSQFRGKTWQVENRVDWNLEITALHTHSSCRYAESWDLQSVTEEDLLHRRRTRG